MSTTTAPDAATAPSAAAPARVAAVSGVVFAVLFVVALLLVHRAPGLGAPDATYAAFYAAGGDRLLVAVGSHLVPFAGIAFLWYVTAVRAVLDTLAPTPTAMAHGLNLLAGIVFVTMLFAGTAAVGAGAVAMAVGHAPPPAPGDARALTAVGYGLVFGFAVRGAGMFALTTTTLLHRAGVLPRVPGAAAFVLAVFLLLVVTSTPAAVLVFPAWVLLVSAVLLRHATRPVPRPAPTPAPTTTPAAALADPGATP